MTLEVVLPEIYKPRPYSDVVYNTLPYNDALYTPCVIYEDGDYIAVYKPPHMHSVPLRGNAHNTIAAWCAKHCGQAASAFLLHRLDYETRGLVLFARHEAVFRAAREAQERGAFVKEYTALCHPVSGKAVAEDAIPASITSAFRPFGKGCAEVRPIFDDEIALASAKKKRRRVFRAMNRLSTTEILSHSADGDGFDAAYRFRLRLTKGARHQIRAHLAALGFPIDGDNLYGGKSAALLELCADRIQLYN